MGKLGAPSSSRADRSMEDEMRSGFQWEKSSGLEHSCFHCTTKSNSPRALQTCYGIHSVPCNRYHQTMHAVGMSHNCEACCNFERMEDGRHRQIAGLLAEFRELSSEQQLSSGTSASLSASSRKVKARKKAPAEMVTKNDEQDQEELVTPATPMTPMNPLSERDVNAMNAAGNNGNAIGVGGDVGAANINGHLADVENLTIHDDHHGDEENDNNDKKNNVNGHDNSPVAKSPATAPPSPASTAPATPGPKLSKAALRATKRAAKQAKSQLKAAKNQTKHTVSVKSADVQFVAEVVHGKMGCSHGVDNANPDDDEAEEDVAAGGEVSLAPPSRHPLPTDTCIEDVLKRNVSYVAWIREHNAQLLKDCPKKKNKKGMSAERKKGGAKKDSKVKAKDKDNKDKDKGAIGGVKKKNLVVDGDGVAVFEDADATAVDDMDALVDAILFKFGINESATIAGAGAGGAGFGSASTSAAGGAASAGAGGAGAGAAGAGAGAGYGGGSGSMSSAQAAIVARLRVEIAEDLRKHENEQRMTCTRAGGFWSYAGKGVFDRMAMLGQEKEWKNGGGGSALDKEGKRARKESEPEGEGEVEGECEGGDEGCIEGCA